MADDSGRRGRYFTLDPSATYESLRSGFRWDLPDRANLARLCLDHHGGDPALIEAGQDRTDLHSFGDLNDLSSRMASKLAARGVVAGERVVVMHHPSVETAVAYLAIWRLGAITVPISTLFGPEAVRHRATDAGAEVALGGTEQVGTIAAACPDIALVDLEREFGGLPRGEPLDAYADTAIDDPAVLIYTSGTTGLPKGAVLAHGSAYGHLPGFELVYDFAPQAGDIIWTPADWSWVAGLMDVLVPAWFHGMPVVASTGRFDPQAAVELMARHGVTVAFIPPTALKMLRAADVEPGELALRAILTGGEALGAELLGWVQETLGCLVNEGYGQTEVNLVVGNCERIWPIRPGSMGRSLPGHDVAVIDEQGQRLVHELGEIAVALPDPVAMRRYWNRPDATAEKMADGWIRTGDLGRQDEDGYLWFESRTDDLIKSRGYRIGPTEIENCLMGHVRVGLSAVVGVAHDDYGEVPVAFVVPRGPADDALADELRTHVRTHLAAHEVPAAVEFVDELPTTATGKIRRRDLRERLG